MGGVAVLIPNILIATMPEQQNYWFAEFWALCMVAFCPDFVFTAAQIIASNSVGRFQQGIASSLMGTLLTWGVSLGTGIGSTVEAQQNNGGDDLVKGYRGAFHLGIGLAVVSIIFPLIFIRLEKDEREGWNENDLRRPGAVREVSSEVSTSSGERDEKVIEPTTIPIDV